MRLCVLLFVLLAAPVMAQGPPIFMAGHSGLPNGIPNACATPTIMSVTGGPWENAATWGGREPANGDKVLIKAGHVVTLSSARAEQHQCLQIDGTLRFSTTTTTRFRVGTLYVNEGGTLEIGTPAQPVSPAVHVHLSILPVTLDPDQFLGGLIGMGTVTMRGAAKTPFVRVSAEPLAGQSTIQLSAVPAGWEVGDEVAVPDTRALTDGQRHQFLVTQDERTRITAITGSTVTVSPPLQFNHAGLRNSTNQIVRLPHVVNFSSNIVLQAEDVTGTRGHTLYTHRATVDIGYVEVRDMGRTLNQGGNPIGRYPIHMHHLMGPAKSTICAPNPVCQFRLIGNKVIDSRKWPITVHNTHYGLLEDNVVGWGDGSGTANEDGNESFNLYRHNFVMAIFGDYNPRDIDGRAATGFWSRGFNNSFVDNVAAGMVNKVVNISSGVGFDYSAPPTGYQMNQQIPAFPGADMSQPGGARTQNLQCTAVPQFERNEAYGGMSLGLTIWNLGTDGYNNTCPNQAVSTFRNNDFWAVWGGGVFFYPVKNVVLDGFVALTRPNVQAGTGGPNSCGIGADDYKVINLTVRNAELRGWPNCGIAVGPGMEGTHRYENVVLQNTGPNIRIYRYNTPGTGAPVGPRTTTIVNPTFTAWPGSIFTTIEMAWCGGSGNCSGQTNPNVPILDYVTSYNGVATDNSQVYFTQQAPGLATSTYHGGPATCTTTKPQAVGLFCPSGATAPPAIPTNFKVTP